MGQPAIRFEDLGKLYHIPRVRSAYRTLREALTDAVAAPFRRMARYVRGGGDVASDDLVWALRDATSEIGVGEVVGIVGRNGAGKSTLLKVLSRITEPTTGFAEIRGRVGSLLEVGSGFHPELSGRENIFLNGVILGMRRAEIQRKFDEIIQFAEIEKFLDTPVKHYSSGMYTRLAFAVAAHLEPEVLIVDEVLAVGDARFQKKCLAKMEDVGQHGRTVLFVSHNMAAISRLCPRTILLEGGRIVQDGLSQDVLGAYLHGGTLTTARREWDDPRDAPTGSLARLRALRIRSEDGRCPEVFDVRDPVDIEMEYDVLEGGHVLMPNHHVFNEQGIKVFATNDLDPAWRRRPRPRGRWVSTVRIPGNLLTEGIFFVTSALIALDPEVPQFRAREAVAFRVVDSLDASSARGDYVGKMSGVVRPLLEWRTRFEPDESSIEATPGAAAAGRRRAG